MSFPTTDHDDNNFAGGDIEDPLAPPEYLADEPLVRHPNTTNTANGRAAQKKKKRFLVLGVLVAILLIVTSIVVTSIVLTRNNNNSTTQTQTSTSSFQSNAAGVVEEEEGTNDKDSPSVVNEEDLEGFENTTRLSGLFDQPTTLGGEGDGTAPEDTQQEQQQGTSVKPPFDSVPQLPAFSKDILDGYASREDFETDLTNAAKDMVNTFILSNIDRRDQQSQHQMHSSDGSSERNGTLSMEAADDAPPVMSMEMEMERERMKKMSTRKKLHKKKALTTKNKKNSKLSSSTTSSKQANDDGAKDDTTQGGDDDDDDDDQDFDVLVGDENFVYAAHGDYVFVWDQQGSLVQELKMGSEETNESNMDPWMYGPSSHINALFVTDDHLVVVSQRFDFSGMDMEDAYNGRGGMMLEKTAVEFYTKPIQDDAASAMKLVGSRILTGSFSCGSWNKESQGLQIVTSIWVNNMVNFWELDASNFPWMSREDYVAAAGKVATDTLIPTFVKTMSDMFFPAAAVSGDTSTMPTSILRLSQWDPKTEEASMENRHFDMGSMLGTYTQVAFIDVSTVGTNAQDDEDTTAVAELPTTLAGYFGPQSRGCSAADDWLVLSSSSGSHFPNGTMHESVFLITLKASQKAFHSVAMFEGHLANAHRGGSSSHGPVDIQGNDARIALTIQKSHSDPFMRVFTTCGDPFYFEDSCMTFDNWRNCSMAVAECRSDLEKSGGCPYTEFVCNDDDADSSEPVSSTENFIVVLDIEAKGDIVEHGRTQIGSFDEYITSVLFSSDDGLAYVTTFKEMEFPMFPMYFDFPFPEMEQEQPAMEPPKDLNQESFYVLDVSEGQAPTVKSQALTRRGFTGNALIPFVSTEESTLLLSIARNMSDFDGSNMGMRSMPGSLMLTIFDVSDPGSPRALESQRLILPDMPDMEFNSDAEWDSNAIGIYENTKLVIPVEMYQAMPHMMMFDHNMTFGPETMESNYNLTMPMMPPSMMSETGFRGFVVFDMSSMSSAAPDEGVQEIFRIDHAATPSSSCFCGGRFQSRSYLFDTTETLVTVAGSVAIGSDLTDGTQLWSSSPSPSGEQRDCCWY